MRKPVILTRQALFDQVWAEPVSRVAERYEISGAWLKRVCKKNDVPVPPRGYWARVAAGQSPKRPRLPNPNTADKVVRVRGTFRYASDRQAVLETKEVERSDTVKARKVFEKNPANKIVVRADALSRHPWAREIEKGLRRQVRHLSDKEALVHASLDQPAISVAVSPTSVERAVLIVDALAKASVDRGFLPARRRGGEALRVTAEGVPLRLELKEKLDRYELPKPKQPLTARGRLKVEFGPRYGYKPSGLLQLRIESAAAEAEVAKSFSDSAAHRLEGRLNEAMVAYVQVALRHAVKKERQRREREAREAEWRRREEERRQWEAEVARFRKLEELALQWERAQRLRRFIADASERGLVPSIDGAPSRSEEWKKWATAWANKLDPLSSTLQT
jgi:hypothetical protein